jgi:hypothetical protein
VAAHSFIQIGRRLMLDCREDYVPDLIALFSESERVLDDEHYGYVSSVPALRDRLQLQGFTASRARRDLDVAVDAWHSDHPNPEADELGIEVRDPEKILRELGDALNGPELWAAMPTPDEVMYYLDARVFLRLALDLVPEGTPVRYNLDDLMTWDLADPTEAIADDAREVRRQSIAIDAPLVVLTEGSSDSTLLTAALGVTHPHLVGFLQFMDFGSGAEGSVAQLAKLVRSFVGAGIANRVIALADNDTAGHDGLAKLKNERLPDGYRLLHYPDLPLLASYPTLGPQADEPVVMDVNGKAGALELYLGQDLLNTHGHLVPVQWTGYVEGQQAYQGSLAKKDKDRLHREFRVKVKAALDDPVQRETQDWTGLEAIFDSILRAFDE